MEPLESDSRLKQVVGLQIYITYSVFKDNMG